MKILNRPWQNYADFGIRLLFWALFVVGGLAVIDKFKITVPVQWVFWPVGALLWWWLVDQQIQPLKRTTNNAPRRGAVTVHLKLKQGAYGSQEERDAISELTDRLDKFLIMNELGSYDGDEFGSNECLLFMYSDNPETLYKEIKPILINSDLVDGTVVEIEGPEGSGRKQRFLLNEQRPNQTPPP